MSISKKRNLILTVIATAIFIIMFTVSVSAAAETSREADKKLTDGVWESTVYLTDYNDNNVRAHILKVSHGSNVTFKASSADYYDADTKAQRKSAFAKSSWGYITVEKMIHKYEATSDKEGMVIAGCNGDFYDKDAAGKTLGKFIVEGNVVNASTAEPFFAVMEDGTCKMMDGTESTAGVVEAIAGRQFILRNGQIMVGPDGGGESLISLGLTANGDVVILCVDGRESTSAGTTMYDMADILQKQGCVDALQLDGGGSATFVTRRSNDTKCKMRNVANDGLARPVSSALLVVKKNSGSSVPDSDVPAVKMEDSNTKLVKQADGIWQYTANGHPVSGFRIVNNKQYLFNANGMGITKTIKLGKTKYYYKKGALVKTSDKKAGRVAIGFCGADSNGQNLIYAYHYGDKALNIGLNPMVKKNSGKLEDWTNVSYVPWMSEIRFIKTCTVGSGVKNLGGFFLFISSDPFNDDAKKIKSKLTTVSLPTSLKTIGVSAFSNNQNLKKLTIPKKVTSIKKKAFAFNKNIIYTFKGSKPPKFGSKVFYKSSKSTVINAPKSGNWKKALKSKSKWGFKGKVK